MDYKNSTKQKVTPIPNNTNATTKTIPPRDTVSEYIATMETDMSDTRHIIEFVELVPDLYVKSSLT